jgi:hypothetical protein
MQAENHNDFHQNDREVRKPWQPPAVEVLMVDETAEGTTFLSSDADFSLS